MQLSVIIVNYNVKFFLEQCLHSVIRACEPLEAEIIVVDNNSGDGSSNYLPQRFPQVRFIWKKENAGFAAANNEALEMAAGRYVLFLNPDTIVPEDCFTACYQYMEAQLITGAMGVKMIDGSGYYLPESKRGNPTVWNAFSKMSGLAKLFPASRLFAGYYMGHLSENSNAEVEILAGAFMWVRRDVLTAVGGFDIRFFLYGEDIDLSYRIREAGFSNYYFSGIRILHFKGESAQQQQKNYVRRFYGAMQLFVQKHYQQRQQWLYRLFFTPAIRLVQFFSGIKHALLQQKDKPDITGKSTVVTAGNSAALLRQVFSGNEKGPESAVVNYVAGTDAVSYSAFLELLETHPGEKNYFIHAAGSDSVVGSSNKNTSGIAIPLPVLQ